jgi:SAM-dependent methyltransferase
LLHILALVIEGGNTMREIVQNWVHEVLVEYPQFVKDVKLLDIGSYDVNGTTRRHWPEAKEYVGVDWRAGPGVDVVSLAHNLTYADGYFDVVISTEALEHDHYWRRTLETMHRLLRQDGLFIFTAASTNFPQHHAECSSEPGYYRNLVPEEFLPMMQSFGYREVKYKERESSIFYAALKK